MTTNRLADVMRRRNVSIEQLVDRTGISRRSIYNWINGNTISSAYLDRLAKALGVVAEEIQLPEIAPRRRLFNVGDPYPETRSRQSARR